MMCFVIKIGEPLSPKNISWYGLLEYGVVSGKIYVKAINPSCGI